MESDFSHAYYEFGHEILFWHEDRQSNLLSEYATAFLNTDRDEANSQRFGGTNAQGTKFEVSAWRSKVR